MSNLVEPKFKLCNFFRCLVDGHEPHMNGSPIMTWCERCGRTLTEEPPDPKY